MFRRWGAYRAGGRARGRRVHSKPIRSAGRVYDPLAGRLLNTQLGAEAAGVTNVYQFAGASGSGGSAAGSTQRALSSKIDENAPSAAGLWVHYLNPENHDQAWSKYAMYGAYGALAVSGAGIAALSGPAAIAGSGGLALYTLKNAAVAVVETTAEAGVAQLTGDESFSPGWTLARNLATNFVAGLLPGANEADAAAKVSRLAKLARQGASYSAHFAREVAMSTAADTAFEVGVNGRGLGEAASQSFAGNLLGQGFGDALSAGMRRAFSPSMLGDFRFCFVAGTPVGTETGLRPIESVAENDRVWAFDVCSGTWRLCTVLKTFRHVHEGAGGPGCLQPGSQRGIRSARDDHSLTGVTCSW